jgi:hypothetical protein
MAAEALIKALNNPTALPNVNALCGTAQTALEDLTKVYERSTDKASQC